MDYLLHIAILALIYSVLAYSLDLVAGHGGLLSVAQGAFYGIGAYATAIITTHVESPFLVSLSVAMAVSALLSLAISLPSTRLHEDYLVIASFCFQMILFNIMNAWIEVTRGPLGISGIPLPNVFGWRIQTRGEFLILVIAFAAITHVVIRQLTNSPFGRVLHAIREDDIFAQSLGKNTVYFKIRSFGCSAALAAIAGSLYAQYISYIDPSSFTIMESILVLSMVIIGGAGSRWGPLVGAAILVTIPEILRFVGLPLAAAANLRQLIYGALLVAILVFRPRGIVGQYDFLIKRKSLRID